MRIKFLICILLLVSAKAFSQEWIFNIASPKPPPFSLFLGQEQIKNSEASYFSDELTYSRTTLKTIIPLNHTESSKHFMFLEGDAHHFDQQNPTASSPVPQDLYQTKIGYTWTKKAEDGATWGLTPQLNSDSDNPYSSLQVTDIAMTGFKHWNTSEYTSWILSVNYSSHRDFVPDHIPLPGFEYIYHNNTDFTSLLGFPVNGFVWKITSDFSMSYFMILFMQNLKFTYNITQDLQLYTEFNYRPTSFRLKDESDKDKKIYLENKKLTIGARYPLAGNLIADAFIGRMFDFRLYQSEGFRDEKDWLEEIRDQTFFNIQLGIRI